MKAYQEAIMEACVEKAKEEMEAEVNIFKGGLKKKKQRPWIWRQIQEQWRL
jgi:hypothetical protein